MGEANNYQLAGASDAQFIIENYYKIIRGFNADVEFQFVFMNLTDRLKGLERSFRSKG